MSPDEYLGYLQMVITPQGQAMQAKVAPPPPTRPNPAEIPVCWACPERCSGLGLVKPCSQNHTHPPRKPAAQGAPCGQAVVPGPSNWVACKRGTRRTEHSLAWPGGGVEAGAGPWGGVVHMGSAWRRREAVCSGLSPAFYLSPLPLLLSFLVQTNPTDMGRVGVAKAPPHLPSP